MSCHLKLGKTHATLSQTQYLASIGARETQRLTLHGSFEVTQRLTPNGSLDGLQK
ncbi:hypothetical protein [Leptospira noguchii]|uniref:hypothetical protein n=1 Tax=Leptospira noguchii TaxID=28182 RepID=UPI0012FA217B|nr:hypothetical protein [Leptospira noguchii]